MSERTKTNRFLSFPLSGRSVRIEEWWMRVFVRIFFVSTALVPENEKDNFSHDHFTPSVLALTIWNASHLSRTPVSHSPFPISFWGINTRKPFPPSFPRSWFFLSLSLMTTITAEMGHNYSLFQRSERKRRRSSVYIITSKVLVLSLLKKNSWQIRSNTIPSQRQLKTERQQRCHQSITSTPPSTLWPMVSSSGTRGKQTSNKWKKKCLANCARY